VVHTASSAAQSGSPNSWLQGTIKGPGVLTFWWKLSATNFYDYATLFATSADSGLTGRASISPDYALAGTSPPYITEWQRNTLSFSAGLWALRWQPSENESAVVWVTDVNFTPGPPVSWMQTSATLFYQGSLYLSLHGPPGETFDLEASADLRQWSKLQRF